MNPDTLPEPVLAYIRFHATEDKNTGCLLYGKNPKRIPRLLYKGGRYRLNHVVFEHHYQTQIPKEKYLYPVCNNRSCINPTHWFMKGMDEQETIQHRIKQFIQIGATENHCFLWTGYTNRIGKPILLVPTTERYKNNQPVYKHCLVDKLINNTSFGRTCNNPLCFNEKHFVPCIPIQNDRDLFQSKIAIAENGCHTFRSKGEEKFFYPMTKVFTSAHCVSAQRFAYLLYHGNIPANKKTVNICSTPNCVNPEHLVLRNTQEGRKKNYKGNLSLKTITNIFWGNVDKKDNTEECWNWRGKFHPQGHGCLYLVSLKLYNLSYYTHRLSYALAHPKEDISNKYISHACDNRICVNPNHLFSETKNVKKGVRKKIACKPLSEERVQLIRHLHFAKGKGVKRIAKELGHCAKTVRKIVRGKGYKDIS